MARSTRWAAAACGLAVVPSTAQDFDGNRVADAIDIRNGAPDCNLNGVPDSADIDRPHFSAAAEHLNTLDGYQSYVWDATPLDFDQDGDLDLATISSHDSYISLWRNDGGIGLRFVTRFGIDDTTFWAVRAGDLNGDGRTDLVVGDASQSRIRVYFATGAAEFGPSALLAGPAAINGTAIPAIGDIDNDGDLDIAAPELGLNAVAVWTNNGDGTFNGPASYPAGQTPQSVDIADFTGDGLADIACANRFLNPNPPNANGTVTLLRNTGSGDFVLHNEIIMPANVGPFGTMQPRPMDIEMVDVDNDGDTDMIVSSAGSERLDLFRNNGTGTFTLAGAIGTGFSIGNDATRMIAKDLDNDGWVDVAWGDEDTHTITVFRNVNGNFERFQTYGGGHLGVMGVTAADFDGDGLAELVGTNHAARTFSVLRNKGGMQFDSALSFRPSQYPFNVQLADFTSDGITDYFVVEQNPSGTTFTLAVYPGLGDGRFAMTAFTRPAATPFFNWLARDFNNDGKMDIAGVRGGCDIYLGNGDGTFQAPIVNPAQVLRLHVTCDVNADGILDFAWIDPGHPESQMMVSIGDGAGRFPAGTLVAMVPAEPESIGAVDITGDGADELFSGNRRGIRPADTITRLLNDGTGAFIDRLDIVSPAPPPFNSSAPLWITGGDFDNDDDLDVAFSAYGTQLLRNQGTGVLDAPVQVNFYGGSTIRPVDIDLDGDLDLYGLGVVASSFNPRTIVAMYNDGTGFFPTQSVMHGYDSPAHSVVLGDIDNNGRVDVLTEPENSWSAYAYLNFGPTSPDVNGNGIPDECEGMLCDADLSGSSDPSDPAYGVRDGTVDAADLFYFLDSFAANNLEVADMTGSSDPQDSMYGARDGVLDAADFFFYLDKFEGGCP